MRKNLFSAIAVLTLTLLAISSGVSTDKTPSGVENTSKDKSEKKENWSYSDSEDKMEGTKQYFASSVSTNQVEFQFPYNGGSNLEIMVRNLSKKNEVLLQVSKGQFMTSFDGSSKAKVKFDSHTPESFSYNSAADGSHDVIFLNNSKTFLDKLKKSKKVMIELTFFNEGKTVFEFNTEGLKWDK
ncbi:hypothetical protein DSC47_08975 [Elizabethkingia miricola]|uniref:hypothetical protein n=1 Tax=Elizabethkingia bruuniana TaxID=1756149 RepID=UPI0009994AB3|nr:hypothetical protein [Elizabethkingia bruuniana]OPC54798.1 hypothetical protein BAY07_18040 [Elizabethkingia bruuniana]OPC66631.1 hypothetical protein BAY13_18100 [Elizabethkingia bruuniana]RBI91432.1 hypothetical protein DSC47_08975 [Elizabethkingia miricola]